MSTPPWSSPGKLTTLDELEGKRVERRTLTVQARDDFGAMIQAERWFKQFSTVDLLAVEKLREIAGGEYLLTARVKVSAVTR